MSKIYKKKTIRFKTSFFSSFGLSRVVHPDSLEPIPRNTRISLAVRTAAAPGGPRARCDEEVRRDERGEARRGEVRRRDASRCDAHRAGRNWERWTGASGRYPAAAFAASTAAAFTSVFVVAVFPASLSSFPVSPVALLLVFPPPSRARGSRAKIAKAPLRPSSLSSPPAPAQDHGRLFASCHLSPGRLRVCACDGADPAARASGLPLVYPGAGVKCRRPLRERVQSPT